MISDKIFDDLPDDPASAFILLEEQFYIEFVREKRNNLTQDVPDSCYAEYMSKTIAAASMFGIGRVENWKIPSNSQEIYSEFFAFRNYVLQVVTKIKIQSGVKKKSESIYLNSEIKEKICDYISKIKIVINDSNIDESKKDCLMDKLSAFENEVGRNRTRIQSYGEMIVEFAGIFGDAAEKGEPVRKWLDSIAALIWGAKNEQQQLPAPDEHKQIEPPKQKNQKPSSESNDSSA